MQTTVRSRTEPPARHSWLVTSTNLDLVRSLYTAWERGDFRRPTDWAHPAIEFVSADGPTPGKWTGRDGLVKGWRDFLGAWEQFRIVVDEYRELDNERVLALVSFSGQGKGSGLELAQFRSQGAALFHLHSGKVTRFVFWLERARALADLGLLADDHAP